MDIQQETSRLNPLNRPTAPPMASPRPYRLVQFDYARSHRRQQSVEIAHFLIRLFNRIYFSGQLVRGLEQVPLSSPTLVLINHPAVADLVFVGCHLAIQRPTYFMAEEELFMDHLGFRQVARLITPLGAFPVDRRIPVDRRAFDYAVDRLAEGNLLILAPEGATERGYGLLSFRPGFAAIGLQAREQRLAKGMTSDIQIVPAAVHYRETNWSRARNHLKRYRSRAGLLVGESFSLEGFLAGNQCGKAFRNRLTNHVEEQVSVLLGRLEKMLSNR